MMYKLTAIIALLLYLSACVKDPNVVVNVNDIGQLYYSSSNTPWDAGSNGICFEADNQKKILIHLALNNETENNKKVTFRVTTGSLIESSNVSQSTTQSAEISVINKSADIYYVPDKTETSNCLFTASIEGIVLSRNFCLTPSYPTSIFLEPEGGVLSSPTADKNIVAWLDKMGGQVSENIKVYFTSRTVSPDTIISHMESPFSLSVTDNGIVKASGKLINDNQGVGKVEVTAKIYLSPTDSITKAVTIIYQ